jgi:ATP-dependent DNA helicase DinG
MSLPSPSSVGLHLGSDEWRAGQERAITWLTDGDWLRADPVGDFDVSVLEAPTGTGKTGLILGLAKIYGEGLRFLILCATKVEQDQYMKNLGPESRGVATVKGKGNFHCPHKHKDMRPEDTECRESICFMVHVDEAPCEAGFNCPLPKEGRCLYYKQKADALNSQIVVTNYAFGLAMMNYVPKDNAAAGIGKFQVIVEDEGHVLDEQLEQFIAVRLSSRTVYSLFSLTLPNFDDVPRWSAWVKENKVVVESAIDQFKDVEADQLSRDELKQLKRMKFYLDLFGRIEVMDYSWVVEKEENGFYFQPVWMTEDSREFLFSHAAKHIIMSGTIPSSMELAKKSGIKHDEFEFLRLPYTFPPENRPIVLNPKVSLNRDSIQENLWVLCNEIDEIVGEFPMEKGLIHTKSYMITEYLKANSEYRDIMMTHDPRNRAAVLEEFRRVEGPRILVSPSFDKAVDLPGDQCEYIIIAKVPYPYLGTKVMKKRVKQSRRYYLHETLMALIQMAGRGVRSEVDVCPTFILDSAAPLFFKQVRSFIPDAIKEAILEGAVYSDGEER